ncbi:MAG: cohesin domain-containing protein, partial [Porcipelethomonas sp.]
EDNKSEIVDITDTKSITFTIGDTQSTTSATTQATTTKLTTTTTKAATTAVTTTTTKATTTKAAATSQDSAPGIKAEDVTAGYGADQTTVGLSIVNCDDYIDDYIEGISLILKYPPELTVIDGPKGTFAYDIQEGKLSGVFLALDGFQDDFSSVTFAIPEDAEPGTKYTIEVEVTEMDTVSGNLLENPVGYSGSITIGEAPVVTTVPATTSVTTKTTTSSVYNTPGVKAEDVMVEYGSSTAALGVSFAGLNSTCMGVVVRITYPQELELISGFTEAMATNIENNCIAGTFINLSGWINEEFTEVVFGIPDDAAPGTVYEISVSVDQLEDGGESVENPVGYSGSITIGEAPVVTTAATTSPTTSETIVATEATAVSTSYIGTKYGDYLYYQPVDEDDDGIYDYVKISDCDVSAAAVVIPDEIDGLPVTKIGARAFEGCYGIKEIVIPDFITSIGAYAFAGCFCLTSITIENPECSIYNSASTICCYEEGGSYFFYGVIYGYSGSTADAYAAEYGRNFAPLELGREVIGISSGEGNPGDTVTLAVYAGCNNNLESFDVTLGWDDVSLTAAPAYAVSKGVSCISDSGDGYCLIVLYDNIAIEDGSVAYINFTIPEDAVPGTVYQLDFSAVNVFATFGGDDIADSVTTVGGTIKVLGEEPAVTTPAVTTAVTTTSTSVTTTSEAEATTASTSVTTTSTTEATIASTSAATTSASTSTSASTTIVYVSIVTITNVPVTTTTKATTAVTTATTQAATTVATTAELLIVTDPAYFEGGENWYFADETAWRTGGLSVLKNGEPVEDPEFTFSHESPAEVYDGEYFDYVIGVSCTVDGQTVEGEFPAKIGLRGDANCDHNVNIRDSAAIARDLAQVFVSKATTLTAEGGFGIFLANIDYVYGESGIAKTPTAYYGIYELNARDAATNAKNISSALAEKAGGEKIERDNGSLMGIKIGNAAGQPGETVTLPVIVSCNNNFESAAVLVEWDDAYLESPSAIGDGVSFASYSGEGYRSIAVYGSGAIADGTVATIDFTIPEDAQAGMVYDIYFSAIDTFAEFEGADLADVVAAVGGTIEVIEEETEEPEVTTPAVTTAVTTSVTETTVSATKATAAPPATTSQKTTEPADITTVLTTAVTKVTSDSLTTTTSVVTTVTTASGTAVITTTIVRNFEWGRDNWNFLNSSSSFVNGMHLSDEYLSVLRKNLSNTEWYTAMRWKNEGWGGSCYGMSSVAFLAKEGLLPFDEYTSGADCLYDMQKPSQNSGVESLINYYQLLQAKDIIQQQYHSIIYRSNKENIQDIISQLATSQEVLIGFQKAGWGGHAVIAYDVTYGSWTINGVTYQGRIEILDPNASTAYSEKRCIYFQTASYNWTIPAYASSNVSSFSGAVFNMVLSDRDIINYGGYLTGSTVKKMENYVASIQIAEISDEYHDIVKVSRESNGAFSNQAAGEDEI